MTQEFLFQLKFWEVESNLSKVETVKRIGMMNLRWHFRKIWLAWMVTSLKFLLVADQITKEQSPRKILQLISSINLSQMQA